MKKFQVEIEARTRYEVNVIAETEEEANRYAEEEFSDELSVSDMELTFHTTCEGDEK